MLTTALYAIGSLIVILGIMIIVHEMGHFAAAKWFGVRVEAFSVGFGKPLWARKWGETEYRLSPIPLGGYVKMAGETPQDEHTGDAGEFTSHPRWQRFIIALAGPAMNVIFAVALLTVVYAVHFEREEYLDQPPVIGEVSANTPAARAGLLAGDLIVSIDGKPVANWDEARKQTVLNANQPLEVRFERLGKPGMVTLTPDGSKESRMGLVGYTPWVPIVINQVEKDSPAARAGLQSGDRVQTINGKPVSLMGDSSIQHRLEESGARATDFEILRDGVTMHLSITPTLRDDGAGHQAARVGISLGEAVRAIRLPVGQALMASLEDNRHSSMLIIELVGKMLERKANIKQISGPIEMARMSGESVRYEPWYTTMQFIALISLNLGIFNLFPIPILDGGMILLLLIEGLMRRDISLAIKERIYAAAFVCLILFAAVVIFNDIAKRM